MSSLLRPLRPRRKRLLRKVWLSRTEANYLGPLGRCVPSNRRVQTVSQVLLEELDPLAGEEPELVEELFEAPEVLPEGELSDEPLLDGCAAFLLSLDDALLSPEELLDSEPPAPAAEAPALK